MIRWSLAVWGLAAGCTSAPAGEEPGRETGACIEGQCFEGLECLSDLCVDPESSGTGEDDEGSAPSSTDGPSASSQAEASDSDAETSDPTPDEGSGEGPSTDTEDTGAVDCDLPPHRPCDNAGGSFRAMGINCPSEREYDVSTAGSAAAVGVLSGFGGTSTWDPTEGERFAVIGTGFMADLDMETPDGDSALSPTHCSDDLGEEWDVGAVLPAPLTATPTDGDCLSDASLVGTGDCSGSLEMPWVAGGSGNDYTELRIEGAAPDGATSVAFDFAFFSAEYPGYFGTEFNDMFVAWLESESWTGNIAFDGAGAAITISSDVVDLRDDAADAPEFAGTCMRSHAGSHWHRTTAPIAEAGDFTLVFAVVDLSDSIIDSYAFVDNVEFGCEPVDGPETSAL